MKKMHGIFTVNVTLFDDKGSVDYKEMSRHIQWQLESGVHGLVPVGATGEFASLSMDERKSVAEFAVREVGGRVPVIVGVVSQHVDTTLALAEHAASIKADGVMALLPPGLHLSQDEAFAYYKLLSEHVKVPVMVYNNPGSCGVDIAPETMQSIGKLPKMKLLKESTGDIKRMTRMVDELSYSLTPFCGSEDLAFESFVMGAKGWVCVLGNVAPKQCVKLYDLIVEKKDLEGARAVYRNLLPMLRLLEGSGQLWQVIKYAMKAKGFGNGLCRVPRLPIDSAVKKAVDKALAESVLE